MAFTINGNKCNTYAEQVTINMRNIQKLDDKYRKKVKGINKHLVAIDDILDSIEETLSNIPENLEERLNEIDETLKKLEERLNLVQENTNHIKTTVISEDEEWEKEVTSEVIIINTTCVEDIGLSYVVYVNEDLLVHTNATTLITINETAETVSFYAIALDTLSKDNNLDYHRDTPTKIVVQAESGEGKIYITELNIPD